jgi:flagellar basal-body rod protein FlgB
MDLNAIPLFAMLKGKLSHTSQRQRVIAQNVANADVPNYAPRDLKAFSFDQQLKNAQGATSGGGQATSVSRTSGAHLDLDKPDQSTSSDSFNAPDSELRLDGNHVVLEEQMVKMNEAQSDYAAAIGFYQQSLGLLKMAIQKPGG